MKARFLLACILILSCCIGSGLASAATVEGKVGVGGVSAMGFDTSYIPFFAAELDMGELQVQGLFSLGYVDPGGTSFELGGRGYFLMHQGKSADLGVGGGLDFIINSSSGSSNVGVNLEAGARARVFLAPNAAVTATLGLQARFANNTSLLLIGSEPIGHLGFIYYFGK